jgi:nucleotide-binding universal stress UspA family protein
MYSKILLAVDGSENNQKAAREAVDIAKAMGAKLTAVYVVATSEGIDRNGASDSQKIALAEKSIEEAFSYIRSISSKEGIDLRETILYGNPTNEIVKISSGYDLLVCGSLGRTGIAKMVLGSVSTGIVKYADCPVLISRGKE